MMLSMFNLSSGTQGFIEDDLDNGTSKAELRKSNKPIMEKRRRARINTCLDELKGLILDALKKDPSRHNKLEKADILEMTVKHLQAVQRQQLAVAVSQDPSVLSKFKGGFTDCAQEVSRYVSRIDGINPGVRQRMIRHLNGCVSGLNNMTPRAFTAMAGVPMPMRHGPMPHQQRSQGPIPSDPNNNQSQLLHRLVAARLAAAGDTAGAAMLLQGGVSMLAAQEKDAHPPPMSSVLPTPSIPIEEPSSSNEVRRTSAFTAIKRSSSPPRISHPPPALPAPPKVLQPTAIRPIPRKDIMCPREGLPETVVRAKVALQPVTLMHGKHEPLDFFRRNDMRGFKRPAEGPTEERPSKVPRIEPCKQEIPEFPEVQENSAENNANVDEEDKDMWRPW